MRWRCARSSYFERALGRKALWARRRPAKKGEVVPDDGFVRKLRIYPHALREANAYYDPEKIALLFGYFQAADSSGSVVRGSGIFGVVSHDIVAHETTHALLDGLHPRYSERTNVDMAAFHEAFADIVALFQHFSMPESLTRQIRQAKGSTTDIGRSLGQLAQQFGRRRACTARYGVSSAKSDLRPRCCADDMTEPHTRGAILVSAVFAAFLTIYKSRCADLIRLATNGSGILPGGEISVDLANRLGERSLEDGRACPQHVHPRARLLSAGQSRIRRLPARDHHRRPRSRPRRQPRLSGRFHRRVPRTRNRSIRYPPSRGGQPPLGAAADGHGAADLFSEVIPMLDLTWGLTIERRERIQALAEERRRSFKSGSRSRTIPTRRLFRQILGFEEPAKQWTGKIGDATYTGEIRPDRGAFRPGVPAQPRPTAPRSRRS